MSLLFLNSQLKINITKRIFWGGKTWGTFSMQNIKYKGSESSKGYEKTETGQKATEAQRRGRGSWRSGSQGRPLGGGGMWAEGWMR